jgi:hypothetical protein
MHRQLYQQMHAMIQEALCQLSNPSFKQKRSINSKACVTRRFRVSFNY